MADNPFYNAQALPIRQRRIDGHWRFKFEVDGQNELICLYVDLSSSCEMFDLLDILGQTEHIASAPYIYYRIDKEFYDYQVSHENKFSTVLSDVFVQKNLYYSIYDGLYNFRILRYQDTGEKCRVDPR